MKSKECKILGPAKDRGHSKNLILKKNQAGEKPIETEVQNDRCDSSLLFLNLRIRRKA
jgi:hypothetical protein